MATDGDPKCRVPSGLFLSSGGELNTGGMSRALALARIALGRTSPNPAVGAVVVREGRVVGEGYTQPPGSWHAEVMALRQAGELARGATMYVTLEPCCHFGRTPPCTRAIIQAGIGTVNMAMLDPNPLVSGRGKAELETASIKTFLREGEAEARELNEAYVRHITAGLPFVIAKWAMTLDGKTATGARDSRWVTGPVARARAHQLRDVVDAIVVGVNTILWDDPQLTVRLEAKMLGRPKRPRQPLRVVVDSRGRVPLSSKVLSPALAKGTVVAATAQMEAAKRAQIEETGAEVLIVGERDGRVALADLIRLLGQRQLTSLLIEGGGTLLASAFAEGIVDKVYAFVAPKILGGEAALTPVEGVGMARMADALLLERVRMEKVGEDILIVGYMAR